MSSRSSSGLTLLAFTTSYTMALTADDSTKLSPPPPPPLPPPPPPTSSSQHYNFFCLSQIVSNLAIQLSDSIKSHDATTTHIVRRGKTAGSAVAMSLLYGITGVIAIMFLVLVTSGAVRAHRYPELYGPRAAFGLNNGQSRVRGLARAVLETLPVYKFGDPEPGKPDPNRDIEAEAESTANEQIERPAAAHVNGGRPTTAIPLQTRPASSGDADNKPLVAEVMRQRPATASGAQDGGAGALDKEICPDGTRETASTSAGGPEADSTDNHLECSICTEEFVVGDDVRVLPCNHKFHPGCVDTWLVNISGTCPLCRLDLTHRKNRPRNRNSSNSLNSIASHDTHTTEFAPPLDLEFPALGMYSYDNHTPGNRANRTSTSSATVTTTQDSNSNRHSRRTSRFFDMQHRLRSAQTMEERIQLLRQLRNRPVQTSNEMTEVVIAGEQTDSRRGRHEARMSLTDRLRDRFLVRTQTQTQEDTRPVTATLAGPSTWREREGE